MRHGRVLRMSKIRAGIVGMGRIGRAHLDALRRLPGVEVAAIAEEDAQTAGDAAARYGVPEGYGSYEEMIRVVDVVHNCTPGSLHTAVNLAAVSAGKHVYAEKPMAETYADALDVYRRAQAAGVLHDMNYQYRMYPAVQEMAARVRRGDVGRVFLTGGWYRQQSGLYDTDYAGRVPGGLSWALADIGTHWLDTARCVLGRRVERVCAAMETVHPLRAMPDGGSQAIRVDDLCSLLLMFEGGGQGAVTISKVSAGYQNALMFYVDGQHCSMHWEQEDPNRLCLGHKLKPNEDLRLSAQLADPAVAASLPLPGGHPLGWYDALCAAIGAFYAGVRGEIAPSSMRCANFADGAEDMAVVEAAVRSAASLRWEKVCY